jgi:DNA-binding response OmpR family regulator
MAAGLTIVVIEDHEGLNLLLCRALRQAGHEVWGLHSAEEVAELSDLISVDIFVVDWNLPAESGLDFIKRLKTSFPSAGFLMVTARAGMDDLLDAYASGADLYLSKPVKGQDVLRAIDIIRAKKLQDVGVQSPERAAGVVTLDRQKLLLSIGSDAVILSLMEIKLLVALSAAHRQTLETWQIMEVIAGSELEINARAVEVRMSRLRKKLTTLLGGSPLPFIKGQGYRLTHRLEIL